MIKKVIEVKRALHNGVYFEDTVGYRVAPTDNLGYTFVVTHDELPERFEPFTMEKK